MFPHRFTLHFPFIKYLKTISKYAFSTSLDKKKTKKTHLRRDSNPQSSA